MMSPISFQFIHLDIWVWTKEVRCQSWRSQTSHLSHSEAGIIFDHSKDNRRQIFIRSASGLVVRSPPSGESSSVGGLIHHTDMYAQVLTFSGTHIPNCRAALLSPHQRTKQSLALLMFSVKWSSMTFDPFWVAFFFHVTHTPKPTEITWAGWSVLPSSLLEVLAQKQNGYRYSHFTGLTTVLPALMKSEALKNPPSPTSSSSTSWTKQTNKKNLAAQRGGCQE